MWNSDYDYLLKVILINDCDIMLCIIANFLSDLFV
jgi:hypothetical protein